MNRHTLRKENDLLRSEVRALNSALHKAKAVQSASVSPFRGRKRPRTKKACKNTGTDPVKLTEALQNVLKPGDLNVCTPNNQQRGQVTVPGRERSLIESFESYYESEEENIDRQGHTELSYQTYKEEHQKGSRRREKDLAQQLEQLKLVNAQLHRQLKQLQKKNLACAKLNKSQEQLRHRPRKLCPAQKACTRHRMKS